ncbi:hypothetical protein [Lyngbya sp. PCC 8106]|uniref:hypothetical protein n=1 Tax=Lyngbya sp. (strain PCC 8106) TaxID=313612 RepID=UPI0000EA9730|nr:hypothetical protein [Lyngbya sp. PCC 8106]EAW34210.1 possible Tripartite transporter component (TRAP-T family),substrate binding protein [Lyngbya sp. PCC 8106]
MKRLHLLSSITTGGATTATLAALTHPTSVAVEAQSQPQIRWKMTTSWPTSLDTLYGAAQTVARRVSEMTDGRFSIQVFAVGEIVPGLQVLEILEAAQKISVELLREKSAESQSFQQTYQPWKKFRDAVLTWSAVGEFADNNWVIANSKLEID